MDDIVELKLSRAVAVTDTSRIREVVRNRISEENLENPPVELVQFHVFIHCTRGTGHHMADFDDFEMQPGTALWIRPGQVQRWSDTDNDFDADVLVFESSLVADLPLFDRFGGRTSVAQLGRDASSVQNQMEWLAADLEANHDTSTAASVVGVILRLFARQAEADHPIDDPRHRLAMAFVESIDNNIEQRSVTWHSKQIGASARSVARATIDILDLRPKEVIDSRVILEAQRRLAWSNDDIATIARTLQFSEASNFTKFFRARTGTSPSEFRESVTALSS